MPENLCHLCGHRWNGPTTVTCPKCGKYEWYEAPGGVGESCGLGGGICDICGCEFTTLLLHDKYCPNCGSAKWDDGKPEPKIRPPDVWSREIVKTTKDGSKTYSYWMASWREDGKTRNVHLGSAKKLSKQEALEKARKIKTDALNKLQT
jgi:hypothetical protein